MRDNEVAAALANIKSLQESGADVSVIITRSRYDRENMFEEYNFRIVREMTPDEKEANKWKMF